MSGGAKRATWADDTDSDVEEAPKVTSGGTKKAVTSWADSDTESEADTAAPPPKKRDAFGDSESESESESEPENEDSEAEDARAHERALESGGAVAVQEQREEVGGAEAAITGEDASQIQNLSKKERKALKQKQLDDLDALLGEFGLDVASAAPQEPVAAPANGSAAATADSAGVVDEALGGAGEGGDAGKKKKKKRKDKKDSDTTKGPSVPAKQEDELAPLVVQPISAALKNKGKKKSTPTSTKPTAAALKAAREAADKEAKKKKRDKRNFNQDDLPHVASDP